MEEQELAPLNTEIKGKKLYMDGYLKQNLERAKELILKDWDMIFLYDGYEGAGKSVKCMQDAYYCDNSLTLDRVTFNPRDFTKAIKTAEKYQAVIYDEAFTGLSSREAMGMINRTLIKMLAEIRQKNLFVFIVMPTFFDLDKYAALWRSRALIHVYLGDNYQRGFFSFYNLDKKKLLYVLGKKNYDYRMPEPNFRGRFTNHYVLDEKEYRKKKLESLTKREENQEAKMIEQEVQAKLIDRVMQEEGLNNVQKAKILGLTEGQFYYASKKWQQTHEL